MGQKRTTAEYIKIANSVHNNKYDYSKTVYKKSTKKIIIICPKHGEFKQEAQSHLQGTGCFQCSYDYNRITLDKFIKESKKIHGDKYDYSLIKDEMLLNSKSEVPIRCKKHNYIFQCSYNGHTHGNRGCVKCGTENTRNLNRKPKDQFIKESIEKHGDKYDYSKVNYINSKTNVCLVCKKHGNFLIIPANHLHSLGGCPICRESKGELLIEKYLNNNNIIFERQKTFNDLKSRKNKKYYLRYDFYIPEKNLLLEYDGLQHSYKKSKFFYKGNTINDKIKTKYAIKNNIKLERISYKQKKQIINILDNIFLNKYVMEMQSDRLLTAIGV
jgi:hypothetical protein